MTVLWSIIAGKWKWLLAAAVLSLALKFGYDVYSDYSDAIQTSIDLTETNAELTVTNASNEATILAAILQNRRNEIARIALEASLRSAETRATDLQVKLSQHDLEFLAIEKPGLIERRINDATNDVFRSIECSTGGMC
jgi:hypothetical protein